MVKSPQEKKIYQHGSKFLIQSVVCFCPPVRKFIDRASLIQFPVHMQRGSDTSSNAKCSGDDKKKDTTIKKEEDHSTHLFLIKSRNSDIEFPALAPQNGAMDRQEL
jgi:hypothetical protein